MARKPAKESRPHANTATAVKAAKPGTGPVLDPDHEANLARATWSREREARFNAADDPIYYAHEWLGGYESRLHEADRARHFPNATEADYRKMLAWADDPKADRQREALDVLLQLIRQHPRPPYSPEVLLIEYARLFDIPVYARLRDRFVDRFGAWIDRAETFLSIGAPASTPTAPTTHALTADHDSILAVLAKTPTKCKTVLDVARMGPIRNRETVGRLLGELAGFGLVHRPYGKRKGYALTDAGRTRMGVATAMT